MDTTSIYTIIIAIITVLGSARAWMYYEKRAMNKERKDNAMEEDCQKRITKLEILLQESSKEKDKMRDEILKLTAEVSELRVKVEFLEKENKELIIKRKQNK